MTIYVHFHTLCTSVFPTRYIFHSPRSQVGLGARNDSLAYTVTCRKLSVAYTVIWFIFVLKIISVFNFGGDLISFL